MAAAATASSSQQYQPPSNFAGGATSYAGGGGASSYAGGGASSYVGGEGTSMLQQQATTATTVSGRAGDATATSYEQSRRQVSSVVLSEQRLGPMPDPAVRYVEVPVVEEVVRTIPKRNVVEVEKVVPKYEVVWQEREVEVPVIKYVDRPVEVEKQVFVTRNVGVPKYVDRPVYTERRVPVYDQRVVEKIVEIPGEVIEVPKPYRVETGVHTKRFADRSMPVVVAQTIRPTITESAHVVDVDVYEYEPQIINVDVHVAKPVASQLVAVGATQQMHQAVTVPAWQYNSILRSINSHLAAEDVNALPYVQHGNSIPFLGDHELPGVLPPVVPNTQIAAAGTYDFSKLETTQQTLQLQQPATIGSQSQVVGTAQPFMTTARGGPEMIQTTSSFAAGSQGQLNTTQQHMINVLPPSHDNLQQYATGSVPAVYPAVGAAGAAPAGSPFRGTDQSMVIGSRGIATGTGSVGADHRSTRSRGGGGASQMSMPVSQTIKTSPKRRTGCEC